jgi:hypothetical protein
MNAKVFAFEQELADEPVGVFKVNKVERSTSVPTARRLFLPLIGPPS